MASIPAQYGGFSFVSPSRTSSTNLSIEHSVSFIPINIEFDLLNP